MGEQAHIYSATQTAVRTIVAGVTMEALPTHRVAIGAQLRELIAPQAEAVGVQVHAVEVRDVMLPGELRKAFSEVLKAKQEGQAALERARGERHARKRFLQTRSANCIAAGAAIRRTAQPSQCGTPHRRPAGARDAPLPANARSVQCGPDVRDERPLGPAPGPQRTRRQAVRAGAG